MSKMIGQNPCEDKISINHGLYIKKIRINNSKTVSILKMLTKYSTSYHQKQNIFY